MDNKYYIYIYLDPRKKGEFIYDDYKFEYEPFYVGKGHGVRCKDHLKESQLTKINGNIIKQNKLKKILREGFDPIIIKLFEELIEEDALKIEKDIISKIGRVNIKTGSLTNMTDGGDGASGRAITEVFRNSQSDLMKKYYKNNPISKDVCDKISSVLLSKKMVRSEETKNKISKANKNRIYSEEYVNHLREIRKGPKLSHRNRYVIISPDGIKNELLGRVELDLFINKNNLSIRKIVEFVNKGIITINDVKNNNITKTSNCIGWEIKTSTQKQSG